MADLKTRATTKDVTAFLNKVDSGRRSDCFALVDLMHSVTGAEPVMWGPAIVGFGSYHYKYESGREGDFLLIGFSPRKKDLTLYITSGFERYPALMKKLGKHKSRKSCLYIKTHGDVDVKVLRELVTRSVKDMSDKRTDR